MKPEKHGINMGLKNMSDLREFESSRETDRERERDRQTDRQTEMKYLLKVKIVRRINFQY